MIDQFRIKESFMGFSIQKKDKSTNGYVDLSFYDCKNGEVVINSISLPQKRITYFNTLEYAKGCIQEHLDITVIHEEGVFYHAYP